LTSILLDQVDIELADHTDTFLAALVIGELEIGGALRSWDYISSLWKDQPPESLHVLVMLLLAGEPKVAVAVDGYH
jgi:hypothetical protein